MLSIRAALVVLALSFAASGQIFIGNMGQSQGPLSAPASTTPPEKRCIVQGKVTNALTGEPLKKVNVRLIRAGHGEGMVGPLGPQTQGYSIDSGADGSFQMDGIEPGEYSLSGERAGYLHTAYGAPSAFGQGTRITLSPTQQLTGLSLLMTPQSVISGQVVDSDGDPVGGVNVMALRAIWNGSKPMYLPLGNAQADEEGHFRLSGLQPGKYYVSVQKMGFDSVVISADKPDIRMVPTYYPDATTRDTASAISLHPGENLADIQIHIQTASAHHIRGKVVGAVSGKTGQMHLQVTADDSDLPFWFNFDPRNKLKEDHTFDVAGVTPGRYVISVMELSGQVRSLAEATVEVGDSDVNGVELVPVQPGTMHASIVIQGTRPAGVDAPAVKQIQVLLSADDMRHIFNSPHSETTADGSVTIQNVIPGKYDVQINPVPKGLYVQSIQYGSSDVKGKTLDLSGGVGGDLQVTLRYGVAELDGTVVPADNSSDKKVNAMVYLIPDNKDSMHQFWSSEPDQNAAFTEKELPPGAYHAVAVEGVGQMSMQNPDVQKEFASRGVEVELKENDKKQIQLPLIPADDVQRLFSQLGIEAQ